MREFYASVGARIKAKRLERKLTRDMLAYMARISDKFLYDIEVGKKGLSAETLYKLSCALNVTADFLLTGKDKPETPEIESQRQVPKK